MGKKRRGAAEKNPPYRLLSFPPAIKEFRKQNYWAPDFPNDTKLEPDGKICQFCDWSKVKLSTRIFFPLWICKWKSQEVQTQKKGPPVFLRSTSGMQSPPPSQFKGASNGDFPYGMRLGLYTTNSSSCFGVIHDGRFFFKKVSWSSCL